MRERTVLLLVLVLVITPAVAVFLPVKAFSRTLVVPDDYPTLSAAIGNATAGDTIFVKKGTYEEKTLEINKTLSLIGENVNNTIIKLYPPYNETRILSQSFFNFSNAMTIKANNFRLSSLTIFIAAPGGYITIIGDMAQITGDNIITGPETGLAVSGAYCNITDNTSGGSIVLNGFHNIIARNSVYRITINKDSNTINNNTISCILLSNANNNDVYGNNILTATADYGVYIVGNSSNNIIHGNNILALLSDVEINSKSAENNTFYHNNFLIKYSNEPASLYTYNLTLVNFWDNGREGNYWDDYAGTDINKDGIGDTPYVIGNGNVDNYLLMFPFDIENNTIVLSPPELFPIVPVAAAIGTSAALIGFGLLIYFKKRKR
ncbi:MAG: hypothetical protein QXZ70_07020 [Candidatus Bathyarchaeia archaeon]